MFRITCVWIFKHILFTLQRSYVVHFTVMSIIFRFVFTPEIYLLGSVEGFGGQSLQSITWSSEVSSL